MKIRTGYFALGKRYEKAGFTVVGIANYPPRGFKGYNIKFLAPDVEVMNAYKQGKITEEEFSSRYIEKLRRNKEEVRQEILKIISLVGSDEVVLCCYEKNGAFCHRHLLAKFLNEEFGMDVRELIV